MSSHGYVAIFLLMILEHIFPPIPSEVILPYVGHSAAMGEINVWLGIIISSVGSLVGTSFWFLFGWVLSVDRLHNFFQRFGGYIAITDKDFTKASKFFERHENATVFWARMIPTVRSVISIPAGSVRMSPWRFLVISGAGTLIFNTGLIMAGYLLLDDIYLVEKYVNPISNLIIVFFALAYLAQVVRFWRGQRK